MYIVQPGSATVNTNGVVASPATTCARRAAGRRPGRSPHRHFDDCRRRTAASRPGTSGHRPRREPSPAPHRNRDPDQLQRRIGRTGEKLRRLRGGDAHRHDHYGVEWINCNAVTDRRGGSRIKSLISASCSSTERQPAPRRRMPKVGQSVCDRSEHVSRLLSDGARRSRSRCASNAFYRCQNRAVVSLSKPSSAATRASRSSSVAIAPSYRAATDIATAPDPRLRLTNRTRSRSATARPLGSPPAARAPRIHSPATPGRAPCARGRRRRW